MLHRKLAQTRGDVRCSATRTSVAQAVPPVNRRHLLASLAATTTLLGQQGQAAIAADATTVGSYLPSAGIDDFVKFVPSDTFSPALRAGVITSKYEFALPPNFKEVRISNTQTGNFCMPRCAEPWTEVVFEDTKVGKIQLLAVPLLKLTNAKSAKITDLGTPDTFLPRIGTYLTGSYFDEDSVVSSKASKRDDNMDYFEYELYSLDAFYGPHVLASVAAKGEVVYIFLCQATDKQWKGSEKALRKAEQTFRA